MNLSNYPQSVECSKCDDYKELLNFAGLYIIMNIECNIRKLGAIHQACWMAKAIYSLKMDLMLEGNETVFRPTACEQQGLL